MWAVMELRGGDLVETHAICLDRQQAEQRLLNLIAQYCQADSWWKLVEIPRAFRNPNIHAGMMCKIAVECQWENDNSVRILGLYSPNQNIPDNWEFEYYVWIDEVAIQ